LPLTLVAIHARLVRVVDVTDSIARRSLGVTLKAMNMCPWRTDNGGGMESLTQAIGRAAEACGVDGIIVPSAMKRTFKNINLLVSNVKAPAALRILQSDKLPPPPSAGVI
jgi:RES domain-containing protein